MDYVKIVYSVILVIGAILIFVSMVSKKGDERKKFIHQKAQAYVFIVVIGKLILDVFQSIYVTVKGTLPVEVNHHSPLMSLTLILLVYLVTIIAYRKKYGD